MANEFIRLTVPPGSTTGALLTKMAAERLDRFDGRRVLIDCTQALQQAGDTERALLTHETAERFRRCHRVAIVMRDRTGVGDRIAQPMGDRLFVFADIAEAEAWVSE